MRWEAERLLQELNIDALPIDPFEIARKLNIEVRPLPASAGGASGMLLHINGQFGICYPTHIDNEGFKNFSVSHEIGHYRLPGHLDAILDAKGQHVSNAGFHSIDSYEQEADHFAAALLMPTKLFSAAAKQAGEGLAAIEKLQVDCKTSLEATGIRYVGLSREPIVLIRSEGQVIDYAIMSDPFMDIRGLDWIRKGTRLPMDSVTATFNADKRRVERGERSEGTATLQSWFNGPHRQEVFEEVIGLGDYGRTLTVLTGIEMPDEDDDDENDIEDSWTPRFHR